MLARNPPCSDFFSQSCHGVLAIMKEIETAPEIVGLKDVEVVTYSTQVVAGLNFLISIKHAAGMSKLKVYKPLPHTGEPAKVVSINHQTGAAVLSSYNRGNPADGLKFDPDYTKFRELKEGEAIVRVFIFPITNCFL